MKFPWKYVVILDPNGLEMPIIFPKPLEHSHVARLGQGGRVLSAGFCEVDRSTQTARAWGESVGLNIKSRPEDETLLRLWFIGTPARTSSTESPKEGVQT